jgi:opacity protein-like surface antigen
MKPFILIILGFLLSLHLHAQDLHLNLFMGSSNYQGDIQDKRFTFSQSHFAAGIGASYDLSDKVSVRSGVAFGTVSGDDKYGKNAARNLNFTTSITEINAGLEYYITPLSDHVLTPYVFAGVAVYHFNPYTHDSSGTKYYLKPLSTEGEGFVAGRKNYNLTQLAIPVGGGIKLSLTDNVNIGIEYGLRVLFTDYLDDLSTRYPDEATLLANRGPKAVELSYRGGELKNGSTAYPSNNRRGGPGNKDYYYFTAITASFSLFTGNGLGGRAGGGANHGKRSQYGCPVNVN